MRWFGSISMRIWLALVVAVIVNLTENAVKHASGNPVSLSVAETAEGRVRIEVRDRGPGIPDADCERLFDRFYRVGARTADGFGLGLSIVAEVVADLGGEVEIEPARGGGTIASIVLGARPDAP